MSTRTRTTKGDDRGRAPYRFRAAQVLGMIEAGILADDVELWDGVLYRMVKGETHNYCVAQTADALRAATPAGYHVREEKSCIWGEKSLPEPDVAVARGSRAEYLPDPPPLSNLALVVEVDHHTDDADHGPKLRRYAEAGIPVYWLIDVRGRLVKVFTRPVEAGYGDAVSLAPGEMLAIVLDGAEVGRVAVADLLPPGAAGPVE